MDRTETRDGRLLVHALIIGVIATASLVPALRNAEQLLEGVTRIITSYVGFFLPFNRKKSHPQPPSCRLYAVVEQRAYP